MDNRALDAWLTRQFPGYLSAFKASAAKVGGDLAATAFALADWRRQGRFVGEPRLEWLGLRRYRFFQDPDAPFYFERSTGEQVKPGEMITDGGTIPRAAWSIPGFSPWDFMPAYVIHDWDFQAHWDGKSERSFEQANLTLAEGLYTLMKTGAASCDLLKIEIIYRAVSSPIGRHGWDKAS
jgi:hypothetical protein